ncbi:M20 family metallopeptidase [Selenomonas sp. TAMA-11512]|uniref:M20 family metallopeptidase n=1 Tax=Selenomonas sp. TAMA-11512 TaxID=3095337 RepID=UPI00308ECE6D|nr:M20 family metallopeptidase [Selenomonas sp. TAMA-11512]
MQLKDEIKHLVESKKSIFTNVSDEIWGFAETRFEEFRSAELLERVLEEEGFSVKKNLADMETAFIGEYGSGKPVIGILGEYDALYGLSQEAGIARKKPVVDGGKGHGCGHNVLGASALAAAVAVKDYMKEHNLPGTVRYYGCPGEESGSGKAYMARAGLFGDVDVALTCHPSFENSITGYNFLATLQVCFKFHGKSAHAGACPHLGRSALDAVELMNVGANFLREHVIQEARIHYAITDSGGLSPNVVQSEAAVLYQIRTPQLPQANDIYQRIVKIAKGAALMTETELEIVFDRGSSNIIPNRTLEKLCHDKMVELGPEPVDDDDMKFAQEIVDSLEGSDRTYSKDMLEMIYGPEKSAELYRQIDGKLIMDTIYPYTPVASPVSASTDVGDVSWNVPVVQVLTTCYANNTPNHSWQQVAQGKSPLCHKGLLLAGKVMALAAVELMQKPELVREIRDEFKERMQGLEYVCPIPPDVKPAPHR